MFIPNEFNILFPFNILCISVQVLNVWQFLTLGVSGTFNELRDFPLQTGGRGRVLPGCRLKLACADWDDALQGRVRPQQSALVNRDRRGIVGQQSTILVNPVSQLALHIVARGRRGGTDCLPDSMLRTTGIVRLPDRWQVVVTKQEVLNHRNVDQRRHRRKLNARAQ